MSAMTWHRSKYAHRRYTWGNYVAQKDYPVIGTMWRLTYNGKEIAKSTTLRGVKEEAYKHFQKALAELRANGL